MRGKDTATAGLGGHRVRDSASIATRHALVAETSMVLGGGCWIANSHAESGWKSSDLVLRQVVFAQIELSIVDSETALCSIRSAEQRLDGDGLDTMVGAVCWVLEVQSGCPVVAKVVRHLAGRAGSSRTDIAVHGSVERIASDDVMDMSGWESAWLGCGIETLEGQGRAWEA